MDTTSKMKLVVELRNTRKKMLMIEYLKITGSVLLYWFVSIWLVFVNKYLLQSDFEFNVPLFIVWFQCGQTIVVCWSCSAIAKRFPTILAFPSISVNASYHLRVLPLSMAFTGMVIFNNLCLQHVSVAFYTLARSLVTIFSLLFTYFFLGNWPSATSFKCCGVILLGFAVGVNQEALDGVSYFGVMYGIIASAFVALNAITIKKVLPLMNNDPLKLLYYNNANAFVLVLPLVAFFEIDELILHKPLLMPKYGLLLSVSGCLAILMSYVIALQIHLTSPFTHIVSGVAKACLQTVIAVLYYKESKSYLWWLSNCLVLSGTAAYSILKSLELKDNYNIAHSNRKKSE